MSNADALIDNLIKTGAEFKNPPEVVQPYSEGGPAPELAPELAPEPPKVIEANDAEGRQAGDPNAPIELPPGVTSSGPKMFKMLAGDDPVLEDAILQAATAVPLAPVTNPTMPPMPALSEVMATPVTQASQQQEEIRPVSEKTRLEMEAGKARVDEAASLLPPVKTAPVADPNIALSFASREEQVVNPVRIISAQTRMEMQAGKEALARRRQDAAFGQHVTATAAAKRMDENSPPSLEDLSYAAPKFTS